MDENSGFRNAIKANGLHIRERQWFPIGGEHQPTGLATANYSLTKRFHTRHRMVPHRGCGHNTMNPKNGRILAEQRFDKPEMGPTWRIDDRQKI